MNYPYREKQTLLQFIFNTLDPRMWFRPEDCECCWQYMPYPNLLTSVKEPKEYTNKLIFIILGACSKHD